MGCWFAVLAVSGLACGTCSVLGLIGSANSTAGGNSHEFDQLFWFALVVAVAFVLLAIVPLRKLIIRIRRIQRSNPKPDGPTNDE
jgi:hypothetical protein